MSQNRKKNPLKPSRFGSRILSLQEIQTYGALLGEAGYTPLMSKNLLSQVPFDNEKSLRGFDWQYLIANSAQDKKFRIELIGQDF